MLLRSTLGRQPRLLSSLSSTATTAAMPGLSWLPLGPVAVGASQRSFHSAPFTTSPFTSSLMSMMPTRGPISAAGDVDGFMAAYTVTLADGSASAELRLPLPGVKGLVPLSLSPASTVADFIERVVEADPSLAGLDAQVMTSTGDVVSKGTRLAHVLGKPGWTLSLGDYSVCAVSGTALPTGSAADMPDEFGGYAALKDELLARPGKSLPYGDYREMVQSHALRAGLPVDDLDSTLKTWSLLLHQDGVILHLSASPDDAVRDVVFLRPEALKEELHTGLDLRGGAIEGDIVAKTAELKEARSQLTKMRDFSQDIVTRARRRVRGIAWGVGVFMVVQWFTIFHFVYEQSWDVMEPTCYFIGAGYGILFYLFFLRTRQDPSTGNVFQHVFKLQQAKLHRRLAQDEAWKDVVTFMANKEELKHRILRLNKDIMDLESRRPPPRSVPAP